MAHPTLVDDPPSSGRAEKIWAWLDRPLSPWWCAAGWLLATGIFVALVQLSGGPAIGDADQSAFSAWALAHGRPACAFPPGPAPAAPLYPLVSAVVAAVILVGHGVPFPSDAALGPGCAHAFTAISTWGSHSGAFPPTLRIGYGAWLVLLAGVVALLRANGRGRRRWETATLVALACLPPVWLPLEEFFHPQDLMALGLALASLAWARRGSWVAAGITIACAVLTQQFAILVAVPLLVLAPGRRRWACAGSALSTALVVLVALASVTSWRAVHASLIGTGGDGGIGTVISEFHLSGAPLIVASRVTPIVLAALVAWWVGRRLGPAAMEPVPLLALVSLCLGLRLAFDQGHYGYYYLALTVTLLLLDVSGGRIRSSLVAWFLFVSVAFIAGRTTGGLVLYRVTWGHDVVQWLPTVVAALAAVVALLMARGERRRRAVPWLALTLATLLLAPSSLNHVGGRLTSVYWQVILVGSGFALAALPLRRALLRAPNPVPSVAGAAASAPSGRRDGILR